MVMALVDRQIGAAALLRDWPVVIAGNAVGGVATAVLVRRSAGCRAPESVSGERCGTWAR
jgi:formate/nitrite transporter FocA (FNT family)